MDVFPYVLIRGGGDLGSGVALRLVHCRFPVVISELPTPLGVRRRVCFSEAVYENHFTIEDVDSVRVPPSDDVFTIAASGRVPVLVDPDVAFALQHPPLVWVDARMRKSPPETGLNSAPLMIGLGPGFTAGLNCHAVIETNRGPRLGRVIWQGTSEPDTGVPEKVWQYREERVLRAPVDGRLEILRTIGDQVKAGEPLASVAGQVLPAPFGGVIRGMLRSGAVVQRGLKIGDVDPRNDPALCDLVSDKALAIAGGVLEAILTRPDISAKLFPGRS